MATLGRRNRSAFGWLLPSLAFAQTTVKNPTRAVFSPGADAALVTGYELDIISSTGAVVQTMTFPKQASDANGTKWTSPTGTIQIQLARRKEAGPVTAKLADGRKGSAKVVMAGALFSPDSKATYPGQIYDLDDGTLLRAPPGVLQCVWRHSD